MPRLIALYECVYCKVRHEDLDECIEHERRDHRTPCVDTGSDPIELNDVVVSTTLPTWNPLTMEPFTIEPALDLPKQKSPSGGRSFKRGSRISMVDGPNASWNPLDAASFAIEPLHESIKGNDVSVGQKGKRSATIATSLKATASNVKKLKATTNTYQHNDNNECAACQRQFSTEYHLRRHVDEVHADTVRKFACSVCGLSSKRRDNVHRHQLKTHGMHFEVHVVNVRQTPRPRMFALEKSTSRHEEATMTGNSAKKINTKAM